MAKLTLKLNGKVIHSVELDSAREYFAGRSDDADFVLGDYRGISRQHLKIFESGGIWHCESLSKFLHPRVGEDNFETLEMNENVAFSLDPYDFEFETEAVSAEEEHTSDSVQEPEPERTSALITVPQKNRYEDSVFSEDTSGGFSGDATQVGTMQLISSLRIAYPSSSDDETLRLEGQVWTAGREADCEIQLHNAKVSRKHFELHKNQDGYFVTDLGSSNGTYLNGHRIPPHEPTRLMSGDSLRVLDIELHFEVKAANLPVVTTQPLVLSQVPWPNPQMPVPHPMYQQPGPYEFDQTMIGSVGGAAEEKPKNLVDRLKRYDWKKNKVRVALMALIPVVLIGLLTEPEKKDGAGKDPAAAADPNSNAGYDKLSPEQKVAIKDSLSLAQNLYVQGKYSLCLAELAKLHETVPFYGNSKELESFCIQGHELTQRKLDNERKEREKAMVEQQIADITGGCFEKFKTQGSVDEARVCLAPAMELNPEHPKILELLQIAEAREKEKELLAQRNFEEAQRRNQLLGIFGEAQRFRKSGQLVKARTTYNRFISQAGSQLPAQVGEAKRELASVSKNLQEKLDLMMAKCKSLGESGKFRDAYLSCQEAVKEDGSIQEAKELMEKYAGNLRREMKVLYEDAKLEESLGNLEAAKEKWKKIREEDLSDGDFNKKSTIKLRQYGAL